MRIETINVNPWPHCDLACVYCYGSFPEKPTRLPLARWRTILDEIARYKTVRVTFSGGEPTLHPDLLAMLEHARDVGLQRSIVTNGAKLRSAHVELLDLVTVTHDAVSEAVLRAIGRSVGKSAPYLERFEAVCALAARCGTDLKVNTVVTRLNLGEDLRSTLARIRPVKWKPLQFTSVIGENEDRAAELEVTREEFEGFVARHRAELEAAGIVVAPETETDVRSTYVMIDPSGRVFSTWSGTKRFSRPVLEVGLEAAVAEVGGYDRERFLARGGDVDVRSLRRRLPVMGGGQ
jgi:radical S-adenosyl methionine domain-containing protein 2